MSITSSNTNSTLLRALSIIDVMLKDNRPITAADICQQLDIPKATIHRIISQLEQEGVIQKEPQGRYLSPGPKLRKMAIDVISQSDVGAPRRAILQKLSQDIKETCNITLLDGHEILYFERVEANWPVMVQLKPGSRLPLHCTASGKLFLSLMPSHKRRAILANIQLEACTKNSITNIGKLEKELEKIADQQISTDNEELIDGMVAIAVPIYNSVGQLQATVAVHAPTIRQSLSSLLTLAPKVRVAAQKLESALEL
ncbi:IclR family transcriptional regulator [Photobacterium makurazakiensis]|uniref:IclR family transcriptional regulator n=1 Tax=Photobacterium makurazakiensis TaxID=2910234 RepID=UPI003D0AAB9F